MPFPMLLIGFSRRFAVWIKPAYSSKIGDFHQATQGAAAVAEAEEPGQAST